MDSVNQARLNYADRFDRTMMSAVERDAVMDWTSEKIGQLNERRRDLASRAVVIMLALGAMYKFFLIDNYDDLVSRPEVSLPIGMMVLGGYWALFAPLFHEFIAPDTTQRRLESSLNKNAIYAFFAMVVGGAAMLVGQNLSERTGGNLNGLAGMSLIVGMFAAEALTLGSEQFRHRKWLLCGVRVAIMTVAFFLAGGMLPPAYPGRFWFFLGAPLVAALWLIQFLLATRLSPELEVAYQRLIRLRANALDYQVSPDQFATEREEIMRLFSNSAMRDAVASPPTKQPPTAEAAPPLA